MLDRFDNATGTGALGGPTSTTAPEARAYYTDYYYDAADRLTQCRAISRKHAGAEHGDHAAL